MASDNHDKNIRLFQVIGLTVLVLNILAYAFLGKEIMQATIVLSIVAIILLVIIKVISS